MKGSNCVIGSRTGLWTMLLIAGVLAVLLACAGTAGTAAGAASDEEAAA